MASSVKRAASPASDHGPGERLPPPAVSTRFQARPIAAALVQKLAMESRPLIGMDKGGEGGLQAHF